jgi:hypothetical protein
LLDELSASRSIATEPLCEKIGGKPLIESLFLRLMFHLNEAGV